MISSSRNAVSMLSGNGMPWVMIADSSATIGLFSINACRTSGEMWKNAEFSLAAAAVDRKRTPGDDFASEGERSREWGNVLRPVIAGDEYSWLFISLVFPWNLASLPAIRANFIEWYDDTNDLVWISVPVAKVLVVSLRDSDGKIWCRGSRGENEELWR